MYLFDPSRTPPIGRRSTMRLYFLNDNRDNKDNVLPLAWETHVALPMLFALSVLSLKDFVFRSKVPSVETRHAASPGRRRSMLRGGMPRLLDGGLTEG